MPTFTNLPESYQEVLYWKLTQHSGLLVILNLVELMLMCAMSGVSMAWRNSWYSLPFEYGFDVEQMIWGFLAGIGLVLVLHELVHGLVFAAYGACPKYGILWEGLMFYATAPGYALRRNQYLAITLAPLLGLSILGGLLLILPLPDWLTWIVISSVAANISGSVGDVWLARVALGYPARAYVVDEQDGIRVFMPGEPVV